MNTPPITIDGYTPDELLGLPDSELTALVFCGRPLTFCIGTAEVLGQFGIVDRQLTVELANIDGGGEGVLPTIGVLADRYARQRGLTTIEWIVHALTCARPNTELRCVLERRGFAAHDRGGQPVLRLVRQLDADRT